MPWPTTSRHKRGYDSEWDKTRLAILERDNYLCKCDECKKLDRVLEAREVHHIVSKAKARSLGWSAEQMDAHSNLLSINTECHKRETKAEQGYKLKPKIAIGLDGFPLT